MARQRKVKQSETREIASSSDMTDIPEEEQWRLFNESGALKKLQTTPEHIGSSDMPLVEEILNATLYIIPISFLLLLMEMCVFRIVTGQSLILQAALFTFSTENIRLSKPLSTEWFRGCRVRH